MNAHGDALGEADPLEGRIGIDEEFGTAGVVAIGDTAGDALDMPAQCRAAVEEINFGRYFGMHGRYLGLLEVRRNPIGVAVDQRHDLCADRSVLTDFEGEIRDEPVDRRAKDGPVKVELSGRAVDDRDFRRGA